MRKIVSVIALIALVATSVNFASCGGGSTEGAKNDTVNQITSGAEIDLGLPSGKIWASCNVGADSPEKNGDYFAWGEVEKKDSFPKKGDNGYKHLGTLIGDDISATEYDAASKVMGADWKMPNQNDIKELVDNCKWEWITYKGAEGYKVTGSNGNSIFLPATGYCDPVLCNQGISGFYWTSTDDKGFNAITLNIEKGKRNINKELRYHGQAIRAVKDKK